MHSRFARVRRAPVSRLRPVIGLLAVLALLVASTATSIAQPAGSPGAEASAARGDGPPPTFGDVRGRPGRDTIFEGLEEKVSLRSQGMKVFDVPGGGAHFVQLFNSPVHYQDADGNWQEIDSSLVRTAGGFRNGANSFDVLFPARMSAADPVRVQVGGGSLSIGMNGSRPSVGRPHQASVTYAEVHEGVATEYALNDSGYKENVILASPDTQSTFTYDIRAQGLTLEQQQDGRIDILAGEDAVGLFPPLYVAESPRESGAPGDVSYEAVDARLGQTTPGRYELSVSIDRRWLEAEGRRYPVKLDPSFVASDCRVANTSCSGAGSGVPLLKDMYRSIPPPNTGSAFQVAGDAQIYAGKDYSTYETYMTFDVRQEIRKVGDMIYDARFDLDNFYNTSRDPYWAPIYRLHRITADWDQWSGLAPQVDESQVWSTYNPCNDGDCGGGLAIDDPNRWWKWDVTGLVRHWIDQGAGSNHGWRISATSGSYERDLRGFSPKEAWDGSRRPYLTVAVNAFPSTRPFVMDDPDFPYLDLATDASPNGAIVGGGVHPVLKIQDLTDSNLDPIKVRYQVSKSPTNFTGSNAVHDSGWIAETHQRPVDVTGWAPGVYYWRVQASDTCADWAYRDQDNSVERSAELCDDLSHLGRKTGRNTSEIRTFMIEDPAPETRDCTAAEIYCRGLVASAADSGDTENSARSLVPVSGPGEVLVLSVNMRMAHCKVIAMADGSQVCDGPAQDTTPNDATDQKWVYKADQTPGVRQGHFARRMRVLARRALGGGVNKDGMGRVPDIVLLQEAWIREDGRNDVEGIRSALSERTKVEYGIAKVQRETDMTETSETIGDGDAAETINVQKKGDTAILYNKRTMEAPTETGVITNEWAPESETGDRVICNAKSRSLLELDLDGDGENDCKTAQQKVQVYAGLHRKDGDGNAQTRGPLIAVASLHYVLDSDFKDDAVAEEYKAKWSRQIADKLEERFSSADTYAIGGDFNAQRCPKREEPRIPLTNEERDPDTLERSVCQNASAEEPFYKALTTDEGYADSVFQLHGAPPAGTDATLTAQYRDGFDPVAGENNYRTVRIDSLFVKVGSANARRLGAASHDLSCGYYRPNTLKNCGVTEDKPANKYPYPEGCTCAHRVPTSPDRYSDHRLVWTLLVPNVTP